ncbi:hypothetical protein ABD91_21085 [Lysinibacillus sphaericus]|uniref:hypothetical protein n=1 Tax=Lysinibacillus sphaericus TaxID=1421 RepID=UPI0018CDF512|nr:hypothetical protein [Lysinibacillus sphaericus]MBG9693236.1 hypothetical protein [Lysinibacillus sphaericus]
MGDFTEVNLRLRLRRETPNEITNILNYLTGKMRNSNSLPNHPFFNMNRWRSVCNAFNDDTGIQGKVTYFEFNNRYWDLCIRSIYKDRGEIKAFLDWILPYIDETWLEFLGFIKSDSSDHPTLVYFKENEIVFLSVGCEESETMCTENNTFNWNIKEL